MKNFIIVPAYNEEENIRKLLEDISLLKIANKKLIFVDDGSSDRTLEFAKKFNKKLDINFILHEKNKGVPSTFYNGLKEACNLSSDGDSIIIIEADNTSDLKLMRLMIEKIKKGAGIVVASRYIKKGKYKNFPFHRIIGSYLINYFLRLFFYQKNITDYTIFYRAYSSLAVKKALNKHKENLITAKSFAVNLEILLKIGEFSSKNEEVPLVYDYGLKRGKSKMNLFKTLFEYKKLILRKILGKLY
jgi:dolichol-phosphate mannosyltransferase